MADTIIPPKKPSGDPCVIHFKDGESPLFCNIIDIVRVDDSGNTWLQARVKDPAVIAHFCPQFEGATSATVLLRLDDVDCIWENG